MAIYNSKTGETLLDAQVPFVSYVLPPKLEKHYMYPLQFKVNYRIVPAYVLFCFLCIAIGLILMETNAEKFAPVFIGLFVLMGIASFLLLRTVPKVRRKVLEAEHARYDFDSSSVPEQLQYMLTYEGTELTFSSNGLTVDNQFFWYNHLKPRLVTSNRYNRVWVAVQFGNIPEKSLFVPLDPVLIQAIHTLNIPLQNRSAFDYLLEHKENAFAQIYQCGTFLVLDDLDDSTPVL